MKTTLFIATALLALIAPVAIAANPAQSGTGTDCANDLITFIVSQGVPPPAGMVTVQPGSFYAVSSTSVDVYVDFFNAAGVWVAWNAGAPGGFVPFSAAYGVMCTSSGPDPVVGFFPVPDPTGVWTYQDGF